MTCKCVTEFLRRAHVNFGWISAVDTFLVEMQETHIPTTFLMKMKEMMLRIISQTLVLTTSSNKTLP